MTVASVSTTTLANVIRPLALRRTNFLFCGNHDAVVRAAIVFSLVDSCKALGVDPRQWMEDFLLRIPEKENNRTALRELLPDKWAKLKFQTSFVKHEKPFKEPNEKDFVRQELARVRATAMDGSFGMQKEH